MSRSYRRPFAAVCGRGSARIDKQMAARGVRRKQNAWLRNGWKEEEMGLVPHRYESTHNDTYGWSRDGNQYYQGLTAYHWNRYQQAVQGIGLWAGDRRYMVWPPQWYQALLRK